MLKLKNATAKPSVAPVSHPQVSVEDLEFEAIYSELKTANAALEAFSRVSKLTNEVTNVSIEAAAILEVLEQAVGGGSSSISESISANDNGTYTVSTEATDGAISAAVNAVKKAAAKFWEWVKKVWNKLAGKNTQNIEKVKDLTERTSKINEMRFKLITDAGEDHSFIERSENGDYRTSFLVTMLFEHKATAGMVNFVRTVIDTLPPKVRDTEELIKASESFYRKALGGLSGLFGNGTDGDLTVDGVPSPKAYQVTFIKSSGDNITPSSVTALDKELFSGKITDVSAGLDDMKVHLSELAGCLEYIEKLNTAIFTDNLDSNFTFGVYEKSNLENGDHAVSGEAVVNANMAIERLIYFTIVRDFITGISMQLNTLDMIIKDHESNSND